ARTLVVRAEPEFFNFCFSALTMNALRPRAIAGFFILLALPAICHAQYAHWTKCDTTWHKGLGRFNMEDNPSTCPKSMALYFVNSQVGFVYDYLYTRYDRHPKLYRTLDSGKTWTLHDTLS
ncbi:MAG: hypothetical protein ACRDF4_05950, partial [Rhabdochlamydiaceae bacterium]